MESELDAQHDSDDSDKSSEDTDHLSEHSMVSTSTPAKASRDSLLLDIKVTLLSL